MIHHGFVRVAAAVPTVKLADCSANADRHLALMARAEGDGVAVLVFPELSLTGYTCADLFQQQTLLRAAVAALGKLAWHSGGVFSGVAVVGLPLAVDDRLFNCAAVLHRGRVLGVVPKSFIPNYKEFYEGRWFTSAAVARSRIVVLDGQDVPFGTDLLFAAADVPELVVGVEVCEDLWVPVPPSSHQALAGATVLLNLSASNEVIGKAAYRRQLVVNQSGRCMAAYVYASCGPTESTTDVVFGGHCLVAENGTLLGESRRFLREETLLALDIDLDRLRAERLRTNSFGDVRQSAGAREYRRLSFRLLTPDAVPASPRPLLRDVEAHPFVPREEGHRRERCEEIFNTQVAGLARRLEHLGDVPPLAIGVSGGLDSTLALLVVAKTVDLLDVRPSHIHALTMPGFGTNTRTRDNALALMGQLGVTSRTVDICQLCLDEWRALGHRPFGVDLNGLSVEGLKEKLRHLPEEKRRQGDLVFENVQARMRTSLLMNTGFVIGTGDLSELALGWCTYNGDHMSMYNPNASIPKTLVKFLVDWAARNEFTGDARKTLLDVVSTEITPELLPFAQSTEGTIGPYELHDFFLFHFLRYGSTPEKILFLAGHAKFEQSYTTDKLRHYLGVFVRRFFANQFKRSCQPDGPKVGSVSLSPRGDWRMPSDARPEQWLRGLEAEGS